MHLSLTLLEKLESLGYCKPTEIQKYAMPILMSGRDLLAEKPLSDPSAYLSAYLISIIQKMQDDDQFDDTGYFILFQNRLAFIIIFNGSKLCLF